MKPLKTILPILLTIFAAGCGTLVERSEKAHWTAFQATDAFLAAERAMDNAGMRIDGAHKAAEELRATAPQVFMDTFDLIQDYKAQQTPEGKVELEAVLPMLKSITAKATKYLKP